MLVSRSPPGLPGCRPHPHSVPKEINLQEGEGEEEGAQGDSAALGPSALGAPEPWGGGPHFCLPRTSCRQRTPQPSGWHVGKCRERHTCRHGNVGDPDFQEITMVSQARGRWLPVRSLIAPTLLELFQSILPSLPYPVSPELGSP